MAQDDEAPYHPPLLHCEDRPLLYAADGTPLKRRIGFAMQTTQTFPQTTTRTPKGKGKKR
jgi:hypothetical protein